MDCIYWKLHMCHHLLETGKRRIDKDGVCLSMTTARQAMKKEVIEKPKTRMHRRKVKAVEDNIIFGSMVEAEKYYNLARGMVCQVTDKPNKTVRGQHFVTVEG